MAAVCASEHFAERVQQRAVNRDAILKMDVSRFIASFEKWAQGFLDDAGKPVIGATEAQLNALKIPTLVVPGNDKTHDRAIGTRAQKCIPNSELYVLFPKDEDIDIVPPKEWPSSTIGPLIPALCRSCRLRSTIRQREIMTCSRSAWTSLHRLLWLRWAAVLRCRAGTILL